MRTTLDIVPGVEEQPNAFFGSPAACRPGSRGNDEPIEAPGEQTPLGLIEMEVGEPTLALASRGAQSVKRH